jgi:hypothetical protein
MLRCQCIPYSRPSSASIRAAHDPGQEAPGPAPPLSAASGKAARGCAGRPADGPTAEAVCGEVPPHPSGDHSALGRPGSTCCDRAGTVGDSRACGKVWASLPSKNGNGCGPRRTLLNAERVWSAVCCSCGIAVCSAVGRVGGPDMPEYGLDDGAAGAAGCREISTSDRSSEHGTSSAETSPTHHEWSQQG